MAHPTSEGVTSCDHDLEDGESVKEGTSERQVFAVNRQPTTFVHGAPSANRSVHSDATSSSSTFGILEDTLGSSVKKKKVIENRKERTSKVLKHKGRSSDIKEVESGASAVSVELDELVEGCATLNLANNMELVNSESTYYMRPGSPYLSSENCSEASDTAADHSDSSDDDNPKSQVDRWIDFEAHQFMDGENSNLSSETDDTDDDSDSDITDVSPLPSTGTSPIYGLSPAISRRNLLTGITHRQPFVRHYSHRGHDGDDEDEDDNHVGYKRYADDILLNNHNTNSYSEEQQYSTPYQNQDDNMKYLVQALLKIELERSDKSNNSHLEEKNVNHNNNNNNVQNNNHHHVKRNGEHNKFSEMFRRHSNMSPALQVNPNHRHLRKQHSYPRRKNMSFTNEEVRLINRDNSIMLDKLLAVHNRSDKYYPSKPLHKKSSTSSVNRRRQHQETDRENLALFRRLQEVKPSKELSTPSPRTGGRHHNRNSNTHRLHRSKPSRDSDDF